MSAILPAWLARAPNRTDYRRDTVRQRRRTGSRLRCPKGDPDDPRTPSAHRGKQDIACFGNAAARGRATVPFSQRTAAAAGPGTANPCATSNLCSRRFAGAARHCLPNRLTQINSAADVHFPALAPVLQNAPVLLTHARRR
jgi:hypothetical protein